MLAGKEVVRAGYCSKGEKIIRVGYGSNRSLFKTFFGFHFFLMRILILEIIRLLCNF